MFYFFSEHKLLGFLLLLLLGGVGAGVYLFMFQEEEPASIYVPEGTKDEIVAVLENFAEISDLQDVDIKKSIDGSVRLQMETMDDDDHTALSQTLQYALGDYLVLNNTGEPKKLIICRIQRRILKKENRNEILRKTARILATRWTQSEELIRERLADRSYCSGEELALYSGSETPASKHLMYGSDESETWWGVENAPEKSGVPTIEIIPLDLGFSLEDLQTGSGSAFEDPEIEGGMSAAPEFIEGTGDPEDPFVLCKPGDFTAKPYEGQIGLSACFGGYKEVGDGWQSYTKAGYDGGTRIHETTNDGSKAIWNLENIGTGTFEVWITWPKFQGLSTNTPYAIYDGDKVVHTQRVNQSMTPYQQLTSLRSPFTGRHVTWDDHTWSTLGVYNISSSTMRIELGTDAKEQFVAADGVRVVIVPQ